MRIGINITLRLAIKSLNVNQVKAALENCGTDAARVLEQEVYWNNGRVDAFLVYPLKVKYSKELNQEDVEKIKEITKLLWDKASPDVRDFWLESCITNEEGQGTGDNYIIDSLEEQQEVHAGMAGEGWLEDFIQEVKDYRRQRDIKLNDHILEEEDKQALELAKQESLLTASIWSKHKGKIALGVTGLCVAGAVAAYVLAYPAVALALAVLAAVILMCAGIAKVLEDPSVERTFTEVQR
ncbi:hypothetical protein [Wolbachia endosymbiont (group A) of Sicus ferrugineus]|uniref:hypothetical protein n=1 Tax=Wolbachia endosymbiont (group A) of Sicus ferrugineus TaxID=2954056 RepID=UPI00222E96F1|nr:hypothetical protein [Wolbachia endosymbiont (group A) of Sicus ferrugineus]